MNKGWFKTEAVDMLHSSRIINKNFDMISGKKVFVEDFIGGKAKFRISFIGKFNIDTFITDPRTSCFVDFFFPKGWTKAKMLETGLNQLGFLTDRTELLNDVGIVSRKVD